VLHVRRQYTRLREYAPPKTKAAVRRIPLSAEMTRQLAELKLRSRYSADEDPVFAARNGKPLMHRNATGRGFQPAAAKAAIEDVTFHSMRYAFASRMISCGIKLDRARRPDGARVEDDHREAVGASVRPAAY
jgi:integrase